DGSGGDNTNSGAGNCTGAQDDESGVRFLTPMIAGQEACVEITTQLDAGTAYLAAWIDFDGDGTFDGDANEQLVFHAIDGNSIAEQAELTISAGTQTAIYCFDVPEETSFEGGETHVRVRYACSPGLQFEGLAIGGEVEDYYLLFARIGNYTWEDEDLQGDQDESLALGVNGVELTLQYVGEDDAFDTADDQYYTTTSATVDGQDGIYGFSGLIPGQYAIRPTYPTGYILTIDNLPSSDLLDSDGNPVLYLTIPDPVNTLPLGENGQTDQPGTLDNYPDEQDDLSFDLGFIEEPVIGAALQIVGVDFASSGTCGQLDVLVEACIQNGGEVPLENLTATLDLDASTALGTTFVEIVTGGMPALISTSAQVDPSLNANFDGKNNTALFQSNTGLLYPGESVCLSLRMELNPDNAGAPAFPDLQLSVAAGAVNYEGVAIPDYLLGTPQFIASDLSDAGPDALGTNPGVPGDTGGSNDPTLLTDCWEAGETMAANNSLQISLSGDCSALITSDMILEGGNDDCDEDNYPQGSYYVVTVMNALGQVIPNPIPGDYMGEPLTVKVEHVFSCNEVWSTITLEDKLAPVIGLVGQSNTG
ncbi:MAG: SdrD B-like domain-containing protein, partial [Bacteroidota bacterium]